jgi:hypothetical protein
MLSSRETFRSTNKSTLAINATKRIGLQYIIDFSNNPPARQPYERVAYHEQRLRPIHGQACHRRR